MPHQYVGTTRVGVRRRFDQTHRTIHRCRVSGDAGEEIIPDEFVEALC